MFPAFLFLKKRQIHIFVYFRLKEGDVMELKKRCKKFIDDLGVHVAKFADNCGIGRSTYYKWIKGDIELTPSTLNKIDDYLKRFNY